MSKTYKAIAFGDLFAATTFKSQRNYKELTQKRLVDKNDMFKTACESSTKYIWRVYHVILSCISTASICYAQSLYDWDLRV